MNRSLLKALALQQLAIAGGGCVGASSPAFAAVEQTKDSPEEKEYIESKYFPKKGKYLDWIEANKSSNQGFRLMRAGKYQLAVPLFQKAIQRYGYDYSYYEGLGACFHKLGNLDRAQSSMEIATQMAPRRWGPWYILGLIRAKQKEYKGALEALKKAKSMKAPARVAAGINELTASLVYKLNGSHALPCNTDSTAAATVEPTATASDSDNVHQKNASTDQPANPYTTIPLRQPVIDPVPADFDSAGNKAPSEIAPDIKLPEVSPTPKGQ
jgi:tetratricopeptide (TPR) repeat protein